MEEQHPEVLLQYPADVALAAALGAYEEDEHVRGVVSLSKENKAEESISNLHYR